MCRCHVFVVNEKTFQYHLKYLFAGTTAGEGKDRHVGLLADICRVRRGDKVVFYLEKVGFFGIFEVDSDSPIYEPPSGYLQKELGVPLIYRVRVRPTQVFAKPVSEWEAIEELPERSREIRWSLLYRKLKGKRGCSYLFPSEGASLVELIRERNDNRAIVARLDECYTYNPEKWLITVERGRYEYEESSTNPITHIDLDKSEADLQAWICWNLGREESLEQPVPSRHLQWFANEVYAGVGTQKMDILAILDIDGIREFRILELKNRKVRASEAQSLQRQTQRYIWWLNSYRRNPKDRIKVLWIAKGFESSVEKIAEETEQMEKDKGLIGIELWKWKNEGGTIVFTPSSSEDTPQPTIL